jgi:hypothetical protein
VLCKGEGVGVEGRRLVAHDGAPRDQEEQQGDQQEKTAAPREGRAGPESTHHVKLERHDTLLATPTHRRRLVGSIGTTRGAPGLLGMGTYVAEDMPSPGRAGAAKVGPNRQSEAAAGFTVQRSGATPQRVKCPRRGDKAPRLP